jgi:four helix bundle protein
LVVGYQLLVIGYWLSVIRDSLRLKGGEQGGEPPIRTFEDLECWKACRELRGFIVNEVIPVLPKEERFRLSDQMLRAARSATANLAEGYGRFHHLENAKFCSNARGSVWELLDHLIAASDEDLISPEVLEGGRIRIGKAVRLINGYMAYLKRAVSEPNNQ